MLRLAARGLAVRPARSLVLATGFGLGIAVMATLVGVGEVSLEQSASPHLDGGGDLVLLGWAGTVPSARVVVASLRSDPDLAKRVREIVPSRQETLYLLGDVVTPVGARGGLPSLERALRDAETSGSATWEDTPADAAWIDPPAAELLRAIDRFHAPPASSRWAGSWAEWLYFDGRSADRSARLMLTILGGPVRATGRREVLARLQLVRGGVTRAYLRTTEVDGASLLDSAPEIEVDGARVRMRGALYEIDFDLPAAQGGDRATGRLVVDATHARSLPPLELNGLDGWQSGYVVPVLSAPLEGEIAAGGETISFDGGLGYHDHNWGSWEGVTWRWGQVSHDELSVVWGQVIPPRAAADPERLVPVVAAHGADGAVHITREAMIEETDDDGVPVRIAVSARAASLDLAIELRDVRVASRSRRQEAGSDFLQLEAVASVKGRVAGREIDFVAPASAETFRTN
jgi:hypothetical protein